MSKRKNQKASKPQTVLTLYHYTSIYHLRQILEDQEIKRTCSNLIPPKNPRIENNALVSDNDNYKPVVWFTSVLDFSKAALCGVDGGLMDKTQVAIAVDVQPPLIAYKWDEWAIANGTDKEWFEAIKETAPQWHTFYVTESPVKLGNNTGVIFRPDIFEKVKAGEMGISIREESK